jgi:hypothetical protein
MPCSIRSLIVVWDIYLIGTHYKLSQIPIGLIIMHTATFMNITFIVERNSKLKL